MQNNRNFKKRSEIIVPAEPFNLWAGVPVNNVAFFVLKIPRDHNQNVPFTDPDFLFYLALDPPHAGDPVETPHADMVCAHHQFRTPEHFAVPFQGQPDSDNLPGLVLFLMKV